MGASSGRPEARPVLVPSITLALRAQEVCDLHREAVRGGTVQIVGKGRKLRVLPCPAALERLLLGQPQRPDGLIFTRPPAHHGQQPQSDRWTTSSLRRLVRTAAGHAGLRHSAASWWVSAGVPMRRVQKALGHASIATTERYEHAGWMDWEKEERHPPGLITTISLRIIRLLVSGPARTYAKPEPQKYAKTRS